MDELDLEKTRIKNSADNEPEKTRVAPSRQKAALDPQNGNTRIASPRQPPEAEPQNGITRIAPAKDDRTRIKPANTRVALDDETTRIDPRIKAGYVDTVPDYTVRSNDIPSNLPLEPINLQEMGDHGILKKRFVLESVLGAGGMGIVYKAKDLLKVEAQDKDPYVAIKVLGEEFKSHPEAFISLQRESRKSQRIAHPNIVNVYDFDRDGDVVFMTMEFLDGSPLDQLIRRYKSTGLPTEDARSIIQGICAALSHAHAEKIIHSDFKPGNVFVTKKGIAKVFDFGIARAVAQVEHLSDSADDKTVFDAGNLGALTPAYASPEMLDGKEPDVRDDIFALGCVAYELFTADHPYKKIPADEAARQGLKPKKIPNIKNHEWKAIEKAIAFRRDDRIESVEEFVETFSPPKKTSKLATIFALLLSVVITVYFLYFQEKPEEPEFSEIDMRNNIRIDLIKENLEVLLNNPAFTGVWQDSIWNSFSELSQLTNNKAPWLDDKKQQIYSLYLERINLQLKEARYNAALLLIENAQRYADDHSRLETQSTKINQLIQQGEAQRATEREQQRIRKQKLAREQKARLLQQQNLKKEAEKKQVQLEQNTQAFNLALENVNDQLKCIDKLNMRNIQTAVKKLRELDSQRFKSLEDKIINGLSVCIRQTGQAFPERALEAKKHGLRIFKSSAVLSAITIKARDACDPSIAGLGARGKRAICKDKLKKVGGFGPEMVVIPGNNKITTFAIGKYEVSNKEINYFCKKTSSCNEIKITDTELPANSINISQATAYLKWLSSQSGQKYRLPTKKEWVYAAKSRRKNLDANRNCKLSTRGIQKGEGLEKIHIGKQNSWGLVNYVGNVQEWVYDSGRTLVAVGGSYAHAMEKCDISTSRTHNGSTDKTTGFRILREIRENQ